MDDSEIQQLIAAEETRQLETMSLIPSENYVSKAVLEATGSVLTNKYSEGYPGKRYYAGQTVVDQIEMIAAERAKKLFGAEHANVQPYSGSPANLAIYVGLLELGDTVMGLQLASGGHLTHGHDVSFTGQAFHFVQYTVNADGLLDYNAIEKQAKMAKPKLIVSGATAYSRIIDFERMQQIAESVGALHMADISHIAGLIVGGQHPSPFPFTDVVMTTTHKTLRGPRGAMILCKEQFAKQIDRAVFPALQGGPHDNIIAAKAIAFHEAAQPEFKIYASQIIKNAQALAEELQSLGHRLISGGTDNHLMLLDLTPLGLGGKQAQIALEVAGMTCNKTTIPGETRKPFDPSGLRFGTPAMTTRGFKEAEFKQVAQWIDHVLRHIDDESELQKIAAEVKDLCLKYPLPNK